MPPEAAVAEKPATPATQGTPNAATQEATTGLTDGLEVLPTGKVPAIPAAADGDTAPGAGEGSEDEPRYSAAALAAEREAARAEARAEVEEEVAQRTREGGRSQASNDLTQHFRSKSAEQRRLLEAAGHDADAIRQLMAPIDAMNLLQEQAIYTVVGAEYHTEADRGLKAHKADPAAFWDGFGQAEVTPAAVLDKYAETVVFSTKTFKAAKPEAILEAHPGLKAFVAKAIDEAIDDDKKGKRPPIQPKGNGPAGASLGFADLEKGYGAGTNTKAQDAEYLRQRDERKKGK